MNYCGTRLCTLFCLFLYLLCLVKKSRKTRKTPNREHCSRYKGRTESLCTRASTNISSGKTNAGGDLLYRKVGQSRGYLILRPPLQSIYLTDKIGCVVRWCRAQSVFIQGVARDSLPTGKLAKCFQMNSQLLAGRG